MNLIRNPEIEAFGQGIQGSVLPPSEAFAYGPMYQRIVEIKGR